LTGGSWLCQAPPAHASHPRLLALDFLLGAHSSPRSLLLLASAHLLADLAGVRRREAGLFAAQGIWLLGQALTGPRPRR